MEEDLAPRIACFRDSQPGKLYSWRESEPGRKQMRERSWSQPDASTQEESRTDDALSEADAVRAELGAFLYPVVSYPETESPEEAEERIDRSILAGVL
jgi:hypothetical protein